MRREPPRIGRTCRLRVLCTTIPDDRGDESFADDLNMGRGIVSGRVALLLRSTEIPPHRPKDFPTKLIDPQIRSKSTHRYHFIFFSPRKISPPCGRKGRGVQGQRKKKGRKKEEETAQHLASKNFIFLQKFPPSERGPGAPAGGPRPANYRNFRSSPV